MHIHTVYLDLYSNVPSASSKAIDLQCVLTFQQTCLVVTRSLQISDWRKSASDQPAIVKGYLLLFSNSLKEAVHFPLRVHRPYRCHRLLNKYNRPGFDMWEKLVASTSDNIG